MRGGCVHRTPLDQALTHPQIVRAAAHVRGCWCRLLEWLPDVRAHAARCRRTRCGRVLGHHIRDGSWTWVRPRARVATAAAACGSRSPAAACGIRAYVGGAMRVRRTAGAAQHASQTLSTLSERTARSHAQRRASACHTFSTTTLAHRQRCASQGGARHMAGAAQHASQALSTLSGRMARSHTQRSESVPHARTTTLAHRQRHGARWMVR